MLHDTSLVATVVVGLCLAFVLGTIANRLRVAPVVGYLLAGVAVGPYTPGFVADQHLASQLAEIGVILLMFGVGLHFSFRDILSAYRIVVPGATVQMIVSGLLGVGIGWALNWPAGNSFMFGLALSVASTVVVSRTLQDRRLIETERGRIAVGWLVFQDLAMVLALVMLPPLADALKPGAAAQVDWQELARAIAITVGKVAAFIALMFIVGRRLLPAILHYIAHTGSRELFRLAVLAVALGVAFLAVELFGISFALGAFFAGIIIAESELSQRAAEESLPLRDAFAVLFFVSVGMLFDPTVVVREPGALLGTLAVVTIGTGGVALAMVWLLGRPVGQALVVAAALAQIGEFSFIVADLGIRLDLLSTRGRDLILGASLLSICANPILFAILDRVLGSIERREAGVPAPIAESAREPELPVTELRDHAVLVGFGRVGRLVAERMIEAGTPLFVIENNAEGIEALRARGIEAVAGNAADARILKSANLANARILMVAIPNAFEAGQIVEQARNANAKLAIVARAHFDAEVDHLLHHGATRVVMGEREIAKSMIEYAGSARGAG